MHTHIFSPGFADKRWLASGAWCVLFTALGAAPVAAFPLQAEEAETLLANEIELEATYESARTALAGDAKARESRFDLELKYGAAKDLTLSIALPALNANVTVAGASLRSRGIGDVVAAAKWRFFKRADLHLALKTDVSLPTGSEEKGLGTGKSGSAFALLGSIEKDGEYELHANVGLAMPRFKDPLIQDAARKTQPRVAFGALYSLTDTWALTLGVEATRALEKNAAGWERSFVLGAIYDIGQAASLAFRYLRGAAGDEKTNALAVAYSAKF